MISFKIIESPDQLSSQVDHFYAKNILFLGKSPFVDLKIHDPSIKEGQVLIFEIEADKLYVSSKNSEDIFWVNRKRTSHLKTIQVKDIIKFGETQISILSFKLEDFIDKEQIISKNSDLLQTDPQYSKLYENLTLLQKELSKLL